MDRIEISQAGGRPLGIDWAARSHVGLVRQRNEDYLLAAPGLGLWVLCDGMGGHEGGDEASRIAARAVAEAVADGLALHHAVTSADRKLSRRNMEERKHLSPFPPGSTAVVLRLAEGAWEVAWVGDSRAWVLEGEELRQVTHDHTVVQGLVDSGALTPKEARSHPLRGVLNQALGLGQVVTPGLARGTYTPGRTVLLLASDGLTITPDTMVRILKDSPTAARAATDLIEAALAQGGQDNVTVAIVGHREKS